MKLTTLGITGIASHGEGPWAPVGPLERPNSVRMYSRSIKSLNSFQVGHANAREIDVYR